VTGALVYVTATPWDQFSTSMSLADHYPASSRQELLAVFLRARKPAEPILGGVSTRRLVSFKVDLTQ
jgi:hypothetical protein